MNHGFEIMGDADEMTGAVSESEDYGSARPFWHVGTTITTASFPLHRLGRLLEGMRAMIRTGHIKPRVH